MDGLFLPAPLAAKAGEFRIDPEAIHVSGLAVGKVVKFGRLPVKIASAVQYMVTQSGPVGQRWNFQVMLVPVLPKLIKGTPF